MMEKALYDLFIRDLDRLRVELDGYTEEEVLWIKVEGINNSGGNLIMHLCGNLRHFIGAVLNNSGYKRDREFEFNGRKTIEEMKEDIEETKSAIHAYFSHNEKVALNQNYPIEVFGYPMTNVFFLVHLQGHLNYHLGQVNYHRRILSKA